MLQHAVKYYALTAGASRDELLTMTVIRCPWIALILFAELDDGGGVYVTSIRSVYV